MDSHELHELEDRCIQECAPWCSARCPVHVDAKGMIAAIRNGDFDEAAKVFRKKVPFPGVIGRICDRPCEDVCKRIDVDEAVSIRALELAAVSNASKGEPRVPILPSKGRGVAVVGAGLSGLTAALELVKKGWSVSLFEASDRLGGSLWEYPEPELPRAVLLGDTHVIDQTPIHISYGKALGRDFSLADLERDYDAVYIGVGPIEDGLDDLDPDPLGRIDVDPVTFQSSRAGVFAGGSILSSSDRRSPIRSVSDGRRAAVSIDRYLQKVSLTASRDNEGPYETRLFTNVKGVTLAQRVGPSRPPDGYSVEEALTEAERCLQCECMECVKVCEYLAEFQAYPKKYLRQIYNNLSIVAGQRHGNLMINSCSLCGLCGEVCPNDLNMGPVCRSSREMMVEQGRMPVSAHEFALRDMEFSRSEHFAFARHQPSTDASAYAFFPGCRLSASAPEHVVGAYRYLVERLEGGVGMILDCCGAPADWSGRRDLLTDALDSLESQWEEMGRPTLILACSTCLQVFKERFPHDRLASLWTMMEGLGSPETPSPPVRAVAVHDPCTCRHEKEIQDGARKLIRGLGIDIHELPLSRDKTECCSFGGLMYFANRALADKVIRRRIEETEDDMLVYCAMCGDRFTAAGKPTIHLLDLFFGAPESRRTAPDLSQSRENRARLKRTLLRDVWKEDEAMNRDRAEIRLIIPEPVRKKMDDRMILVEDIREVVEWAERTGRKLLNRETGAYLAHYRPSTVTYWVEYAVEEGGYVIHNAYSHRMEVLEGGSR